MASLMENLMEVLEKENEEYQILISLSNDKTPAIIEGNLEKLNTITDEEQNVVSRINQLEKYREETINDIANVINKDVKTLTLSRLIELLENRPNEQKRLAIIHDKLHETTSLMMEVNEHNKMLIENALEMVEFDINLLKASKLAPSTANYNKGAYSAGAVIGTDVGSFDAKQ